MSGKLDNYEENGQKGVIPHIIDDLFYEMHNVEIPTEFSIGVSFSCLSYAQIRFVEIYMERIRDLLDPTASNLKIHISPYEYYE